MSMPYDVRTAIVMLRENAATVYASSNPGGVLTRVEHFTAKTDSEIEDTVAGWLEEARRAGTFDRWMIAASAPRIERVCAMVSSATRGMLAATRADDLTSVPAEDIRSLVPPAAWF